jgi:stalled ribosome rescue protein Dom34
MSKHALVWLDHNEAKVFHFHPDSVDAATVQTPKKHVHRHPKGAEDRKDHPDDMKRYYHSVVESLAGAEHILVVGPGKAKLEFVRHTHKHDPAVEPKIIGVETVDHPTDGQLIAYAKKYFVAADRMV